MNTKYSVLLGLTFDEAVKEVRASLKEHSFGVITEMNLTEKFKEKLDKDFRNYIVLGACNPHFAFEAINHNEDVGLLLPCNVLVCECDDGVRVSSMKATHMLSLLNDAEVCRVAAKVDENMGKVFARLITINEST